MFKVGDKIICVEVPHFRKPVASGLTVGKVYHISEIRPNPAHRGLVLFVMTDAGMSFGFSSERFVPITEYRKRKIKKICSKLETR